jgi:uncharacterized iron-regulated membrane protein
MSSDIIRRWMRQPQNVWLRRALFQVHLWTGIGVGLYVLMISVTGGVLVYRNELYRAATPKPIIVKGSGPRLTDDELKEAATRAYPGYLVFNVARARNRDQAVDVSLRRGAETKRRLLDPYTGRDLGEAVPPAIRFVSKMLELHDDLLAGRTGRKVNGCGALLLIVLAITGIVIWWPGIKTWRRSLIVHRGVGWKRLTWELHSMIGFWSLGFTLLFGFTGLYLGNPELFQNAADWIQPVTDANASSVRFVDQVIYWIAYLHFGRLGGRVPGCGRGLCDTITKSVWAFFGLAPALMFVTGAIIWWNRVLAPRWQRNAKLRAGSATMASPVSAGN